MSVYNDIWGFGRSGDGGRALDTATRTSGADRSYVGTGGLFAAASRMRSSVRVIGSVPSQDAWTPRRRVSPRAMSPLALLYIQSPKKVSAIPTP